MIGRLTRKVLKKPNLRLFSEAARKARMEVSVRSPYKTFLADCDAFSRIVTRTNEATLVIQNQTPPATYVLPPGRLQVRLTEDNETSGDYIHTGGWAVIHPDNTCDINLFECFEKDEVNAEGIADFDLGEAGEGVQGQFVDKIRKAAHSTILKNL